MTNGQSIMRACYVATHIALIDPRDSKGHEREIAEQLIAEGNLFARVWDEAS